MPERAWLGVTLVTFVASMATCAAFDELNGLGSTSSGTPGGTSDGAVDPPGGAKREVDDFEGNGGTGTVPALDGGTIDDGSGGATSEGAGGAGGAGGVEPPVTSVCLEMASKRFAYAMRAEDSNAMASPAYVRDMLKNEDGEAPSLGASSRREFLNYYTLDYEISLSSPMAITATLEGPLADASKYRLIVGVQASPSAGRKPMTITLVIDTSLSMAGDPIERARDVGKAIAASMAAGDKVNLVTWDPSAPPNLAGYTVSGPDDPELISAISSVYEDEGADLQAGLVRGYELAAEHFTPGGLNRLVFISDGRLTLGTDAIQYITDHAAKDLYLVGVATGPAKGYSDHSMALAANKGGGAYVYIDSELEARRMFVSRFDEVMDIAAREMIVNVTLPGYFDIPGFMLDGPPPGSVRAGSVGEALAPGDSMTLVYDVTACHSSVIHGDDPVALQVEWRVPGEDQPRRHEESLTVGLLRGNQHFTLQKAAAILAYVDALNEPSQAALSAAHTKVADLLTALEPLGGDPELEEIKALIERHPIY